VLGWVPYAALGDLRYGGRLHELMAGSIFAGATHAENVCLADCGVVLGAYCRGGGSVAELYYVEGWRLREIDRVLEAYGARRVTVTLSHGGFTLHAEAHLAEGCQQLKGEEAGWTRLLLLLPPLQPPPVQPMAVYRVEVDGIEACYGGRVFCPSGGGGIEAAAADVYAEPGRVAEWARGFQAEIRRVAGRLKPQGLTVLLHAPIAAGREKLMDTQQS
jgi:gamma-glutamylcyclotransferase (GGCT)/AIG2-like uncharacterized protein YtfP